MAEICVLHMQNAYPMNIYTFFIAHHYSSPLHSVVLGEKRAAGAFLSALGCIDSPFKMPHGSISYSYAILNDVKGTQNE